MNGRFALLIATYQYEDSGLRQLTAPAHDAEALANVLRDPAIAGFEVTTLVNKPHHVVGQAIGDFYRDRRRDDLTLLYFTGHGLKDDTGELYLAMADTARDNLLFTGLPADRIDRAMENCRSRQKVLILDCCYSGAFPSGRLAKADTAVHTMERFRGNGRTVLTASDATQYAFEGDQLHGEATQSVFTRYLVAGLRDGSADLDGDGDITLDELYSYVYDRVVEEMPQQRPKKQDDVEGRTVIAANINWALPSYLQNALASPIAKDRLSALDGLTHLRRIGNPTVRAHVNEEIRRLANDDSKQVSAAATALLSPAPPPEAEQRRPTIEQAAAPPTTEPQTESAQPEQELPTVERPHEARTAEPKPAAAPEPPLASAVRERAGALPEQELPTAAQAAAPPATEPQGKSERERPIVERPLETRTAEPEPAAAPGPSADKPESQPETGKLQPGPPADGPTPMDSKLEPGPAAAKRLRGPAAANPASSEAEPPPPTVRHESTPSTGMQESAPATVEPAPESAGGEPDPAPPVTAPEQAAAKPIPEVERRRESPDPAPPGAEAAAQLSPGGPESGALGAALPAVAVDLPVAEPMPTTERTRGVSRWLRGRYLVGVVAVVVVAVVVVVWVLVPSGGGGDDGATSTGGGGGAVLTGFDESVDSVRFSADGKRLAAVSGVKANANQRARIYTIAQGSGLTVGAYPFLVGATDVEFSNDTDRVVVARNDASVDLVRANDSSVIKTVHRVQGSALVAFSPGGGVFATTGTLVGPAHDNPAVLWGLDGLGQGTLSGPQNGIQSLQFSLDGTLLAAAVGGQPSRIFVWEMPSGKLRTELAGGTSIRFSPDGRLAISGDQEPLRLQAVDPRQVTIAFEPGVPLGFTPDGKYLAARNKDRTVRIYDTKTGQVAITLPDAYPVAISPDGKKLASSSPEHAVKILDTSDGHVIASLTGNTAEINDLAFSPDGKLIAAAGNDKAVRLWNVPQP